MRESARCEHTNINSHIFFFHLLLDLYALHVSTYSTQTPFINPTTQTQTRTNTPLAPVNESLCHEKLKLHISLAGCTMVDPDGLILSFH